VGKPQGKEQSLRRVWKNTDKREIAQIIFAGEKSQAQAALACLKGIVLL